MPGLWLSTAGPAGHGLDLGAPYLASRVFGDGNLWDALETAELQDVALSLWAQGTTHFTGVLSPAQAEPQASVIATGIFWCGTYLHEDSDSWGLLPGGGFPRTVPSFTVHSTGLQGSTEGLVERPSAVGRLGR